MSHKGSWSRVRNQKAYADNHVKIFKKPARPSGNRKCGKLPEQVVAKLGIRSKTESCGPETAETVQEDTGRCLDAPQ